MLKFPKTKFQLLLSVLAMLMAQMEDGVEAQNSHGDPCTNQCQKVQHHHHHLHRHRHHSSSSSEDESSLSPISVKSLHSLMSANIWLRNSNPLSSSFSGKTQRIGVANHHQPAISIVVNITIFIIITMLILIFRETQRIGVKSEDEVQMGEWCVVSKDPGSLSTISTLIMIVISYINIHNQYDIILSSLNGWWTKLLLHLCWQLLHHVLTNLNNLDQCQLKIIFKIQIHRTGQVCVDSCSAKGEDYFWCWTNAHKWGQPW